MLFKFLTQEATVIIRCNMQGIHAVKLYTRSQYNIKFLQQPDTQTNIYTRIIINQYAHVAMCYVHFNDIIVLLIDNIL